jgi:predicted esterase
MVFIVKGLALISVFSSKKVVGNVLKNRQSLAFVDVSRQTNRLSYPTTKRLFPKGNAISFLLRSNSCSLNRSSENTSVEDTMDTSKQFQILALHGSGGTGSSMIDTLQEWNKNMILDSGNTDEDNVTTLHMNITTVTAQNPMDNGYSWWKLGPGERSFNADSYQGFDASRELVLKTFENQSQPYDIIFGHSQGAILITALLALNVIPHHPRIGYILNGVAWPNPYSLELESVQLQRNQQQSESSMNTEKIRVLMIVGDRDTINPPEQAYRVVAALEKAGCNVTVVSHPNGHSVPVQHGTPTWKSITQWISLLVAK